VWCGVVCGVVWCVVWCGVWCGVVCVVQGVVRVVQGVLGVVWDVCGVQHVVCGVCCVAWGVGCVVCGVGCVRKLSSWAQTLGLCRAGLKISHVIMHLLHRDSRLSDVARPSTSRHRRPCAVNLQHRPDSRGPLFLGHPEWAGADQSLPGHDGPHRATTSPRGTVLPISPPRPPLSLSASLPFPPPLPLSPSPLSPFPFSSPLSPLPSTAFLHLSPPLVHSTSCPSLLHADVASTTVQWCCYCCCSLRPHPAPGFAGRSLVHRVSLPLPLRL
jgi:hypothetical protein